VSGVVSAANSLVGSSTGDGIGSAPVSQLSNGNYLVRSGNWDNGAFTNAGAVTWGSGTSGVSGTVGAAISLVGSSANDSLGNGGVFELANGNYLVTSTTWSNAAAPSAGAVTWGSGTSGVRGVLSAANSLVGSSTSDSVGNGGVLMLSGSNYVVLSYSWDNGLIPNAGAATWGNGSTGVSGVISAANSLTGSTSGDNVGGGTALQLSNGNYVVLSPNWDNGSVVNAGAVTWGSGSSGITGPVSSSNSLVGQWQHWHQRRGERSQ
jgi:hypothetical protein